MQGVRKPENEESLVLVKVLALPVIPLHPDDLVLPHQSGCVRADLEYPISNPIFSSTK